MLFGRAGGVRRDVGRSFACVHQPVFNQILFDLFTADIGKHLPVNFNTRRKRPVAMTFSRSALEAPAHPSIPAKRSDTTQILCCSGFNQACSFCNPSSKRVFTVPNGSRVVAAISR